MADTATSCRHCGKLQQVAEDLKDWLCAACERWQDTIACPTCSQPVAISLHPELAPPVHPPEPSIPDTEPPVEPAQPEGVPS